MVTTQLRSFLHGHLAHCPLPIYGEPSDCPNAQLQSKIRTESGSVRLMSQYSAKHHEGLLGLVIDAFWV